MFRSSFVSLVVVVDEVDQVDEVRCAVVDQSSAVAKGAAQGVSTSTPLRRDASPSSFRRPTKSKEQKTTTADADAAGEPPLPTAEGLRGSAAESDRTPSRPWTRTTTTTIQMHSDASCGAGYRLGQ